jgi:HEAT repeat protein
LHRTRSLSGGARALRSRLYAHKSTLELVELLANVEASGEPELLPEVLPFLRRESPKLMIAAEHAAAGLLAATRVADLPWLDLLLRHTSFHGPAYPPAWSELSPKDVERFEATGKTGFALLALAGSHRSGFVREAAVRRLSSIRDGRELPFLLIRISDWVESVARLSRASLVKRLSAGYVPQLVVNLPLILRLREPGRKRSATDLVEEVTAFLLREENRSFVAAALKPDRERDVRRACAALLFDPVTPARSEEIDLGLTDREPILRLRAARRLSALSPGEDRARLLAKARRDPFMPVRREAFEEKIREDPGAAAAEAEAALFDPHSSLRQEARRVLALSEPRDFAATYRQALSTATGRTLVATLAGLGETGAKTDTAAILPFLRHPLARARAAAIGALGKLDARSFLPHFLEILGTDSGRPFKEAIAVLRANVSYMPSERIWAAVTSSDAGAPKPLSLWLVASYSKWESLPYLLMALTWDDEPMARAARFHLDRWFQRFNRSFTKPSPDQLGRIRTAMDQAGDRLSALERQQLEMVIAKGW